ncbi:hypothetical protein D3C86_1769080 [compost metagenome]
MSCPTCNHLNAATDVRCIRCGTTLIHEALGHSEAYRKTTDSMDARVYGGVGAFFGFCVVATLLKFVLAPPWLDDRELYAFATGGAVVGGLLARLFLRSKQRML